MNLPGQPVPVPVPVMHASRRPDEYEALLFESTSSSELLELFVPIGRPDYVGATRMGLDYMAKLRQLLGGDATP